MHLVVKLVVLIMLLIANSAASQDLTPASERGPGTRPSLSAAEAPAGTEKLRVQWMKVSAPGQGAMLLAIARPRGTGPFPLVVLLHGTHRFAQQYVQMAQDLSNGGFIVVAACWFSSGTGAGTRFMTPIDCPEAPPLAVANSPETFQRVTTLVHALRALPRTQPGRVALVGHSRGGGAALNYILRASDVRAAVLNSTGYPTEMGDRASEVRAPILMLHGTADSPADGGSAVTNEQMARHFETALRRAGKPVEATYYEDGGHNSLFSSSTQYRDELRRILEFLGTHLRN